MNYQYKETEVRKYLRRNRSTGKEEMVTVSNRNNINIERHLELLNLNDSEFEYYEANIQ